MSLRAGLAVAAGVLGALLFATPAGAAFHLMKVSEVHPGTAANPDGAFVELQMIAAGQNNVAGHEIVVYTAGGAVAATVPMPANLGNGANNATVLLGDSSVTNADVAANIGTLVSPAGGAVCFPDGQPPDCVSWGSFSAPGALPGATGAPAAPAGIPDGQSLTRSIAAGCPTLHESSDDTDDSAADFALTAPSPRPNSVQPTETPCVDVAPSTLIDKGPKKRTAKRSARFRFSSDAAAASFECKLDKESWEACSSPQRYQQVKRGRHVFRVRATAGGVTDPSPASYRWKRKPKKS